MIIIINNSILGKRGNIGFRIRFVWGKLKNINSCVRTIVFCRNSLVKSKNIITLGVFGYFVRVLHYLRRNFFKKFDSRSIDIFIFESVFFLYFPILFFFLYSKDEKNVAYITEPSVRIINYLKKKHFKIVLDLPIAPNAYVLKVLSRFPDCGLVYQERIDRLERSSIELADIVIVPSVFVCDELIDLAVSKGKLSIIPFGVNPLPSCMERSMENRNMSSVEHPVRYVFAGNVSSRKGIQYLMDAWAKYRVLYPSDELHLCGAITREMRTYINKIGNKGIHLPGFVNTDQYFADCDIYVFPSLMEGSSKSVYEAMNHGLPCIVTRESGSIVRDGLDGYVIDSFSMSAILDAMVKLRNNDYIAMRVSAKNQVLPYTWERYASTVVRVLDQ